MTPPIPPAASVSPVPPTPPLPEPPLTQLPPNAANDSSDGGKDRLDFLWKIHGYTNDYIRFADTKAGFVAATMVALIGALVASHSFDSLTSFTFRHWPVRIWWGASALVLLLLSFMCALFAIRPRLRSTVPKGFIFWSSVVEHESDLEYAAECRTLTGLEMEENVSRHIFALARICKRKYFWTNLAILIGVAGGVLAGGFILVLPRLRR